MKRQHPTDHNLFWCPKCKTYKGKKEYRNSKRFHGIGAYCRECLSPSAHELICAECGHKFIKRYGSNAICCDKCRPLRKARITKQWQKNNPEKSKNMKRRIEKDGINKLADRYIAKLSKADGLKRTSTMIELKRQQIIMKRTLKEFKQWRKENEK